MAKKRVSDVSSVWLSNLGLVIRTARKDLRLSYREVAHLAGVSPSQVLRMESGNFDFAFTNFLKVAQVLRIPVGSMLEYIGRRPTWFKVWENSRRDLEIHGLATKLGADSKRHKKPEDRLEFLKMLVDRIGEEACALHLSSNPQEAAKHLIFNYTPASDRLLEYAQKIDPHASVLERDALIQTIQTKPVSRLLSLGILDEQFMADYLKWCDKSALPDFDLQVIPPRFFLKSPDFKLPQSIPAKAVD